MTFRQWLIVVGILAAAFILGVVATVTWARVRKLDDISERTWNLVAGIGFGIVGLLCVAYLTNVGTILKEHRESTDARFEQRESCTRDIEEALKARDEAIIAALDGKPLAPLPPIPNC